MQAVQRVSVRVKRQPPQRKRSHLSHAEEVFLFCFGFFIFYFLASDVLLLGEGVRRHSRGRGRQPLHRGVFKDGRGVRGRREGVFGGGGAGAAAGGRGGLRLVGLLRQEGERRVDGRGVGLRVVLLVAGQSVAHVVCRVWELLVKAAGVLQVRTKVRTEVQLCTRHTAH